MGGSGGEGVFAPGNQFFGIEMTLSADTWFCEKRLLKLAPGKHQVRLIYINSPLPATTPPVDSQVPSWFTAISKPLEIEIVQDSVPAP